MYQNAAVQHGSITLLPIFVGVGRHSETHNFSVYARMLNPYGSSGNRMGFIYGYDGSSYAEIVFGADGIARFNDVNTSAAPDGTTNATVTPRETAPYPWARNQWFDVEFLGSSGVGGSPDQLIVSVNGTRVFDIFEVLGLRGPIGLVTNWTPGRFDDVWSAMAA
jgi:hypothetical protein